MAAEITISEAEDHEIRSARPRMGAKLRIEQHDIRPRMARVWLNDVELTAPGGGLMGFSIDFSGNAVTTAILKVGLEDLEIDAETLVMLQMIYKEKRGG